MGIHPDIITAFVDGTKFLLRIMPVFAAGVFAAHLIENMGRLDGLSRLAGPIMRLGRLSNGCGAGFVTSIISPTAGHAMLADLRREGKLGRRELIVAAIVNNLPGEIATGKSVLPLAVPVLGFFGFVYYGFLLLACTLKALIMLLAGRFFLAPLVISPEYSEIKKRQNWNFGVAARASIKPSFKSVFKVSKTMVPAAYIVYGLITIGFFDNASGPLSFMTDYLPLNLTVLPVVAARLISPAAAYIVAGGIFAAGTASGPQLIFALFAGAFAATATSLRYLIPYYCGIFGGRDGGAIIVVSLIARVISYGAVLAILAFFIGYKY